MKTKQFKKVDAELMQIIVEIIARSKTDFTFLQIQDVINKIKESETLEEEVEEDTGNDK